MPVNWPLISDEIRVANGRFWAGQRLQQLERVILLHRDVIASFRPKAALRQVGRTTGWRLCHSVAVSYAYAILNSVPSPSRRPVNWMLYGRPSGENPQGRQIAGTPARSIGIVNSADLGAAADHAA